MTKSKAFCIGKVNHFKIMIQLRNVRGESFDIQKWYDENGHPRNISRRVRIPSEENLKMFNEAQTDKEKSDALILIHSQK